MCMSVELDHIKPSLLMNFQNSIDWDYFLGTIQGGVISKGLQKMPLQVPQDMAFPNFINFFWIYV
jgi:hypothetical protein